MTGGTATATIQDLHQSGLCDLRGFGRSPPYVVVVEGPLPDFLWWSTSAQGATQLLQSRKSKKEKLESKGWRFGTAEDFLCHAREKRVDRITLFLDTVLRTFRVRRTSFLALASVGEAPSRRRGIMSHAAQDNEDDPARS